MREWFSQVVNVVLKRDQSSFPFQMTKKKRIKIEKHPLNLVKYMKETKHDTTK